jgi:hypothetical protein
MKDLEIYKWGVHTIVGMIFVLWSYTMLCQLLLVVRCVLK